MGGDQDLGPRFLSLIWVEGCIATVVVATRFYARYVYAKRTAWDDWMMLMTLVGVLTLDGPHRTPLILSLPRLSAIHTRSSGQSMP